jgi:hypothetical protein
VTLFRYPFVCSLHTTLHLTRYRSLGALGALLQGALVNIILHILIPTYGYLGIIQFLQFIDFSPECRLILRLFHIHMVYVCTISGWALFRSACVFLNGHASPPHRQFPSDSTYFVTPTSSLLILFFVRGIASFPSFLLSYNAPFLILVGHCPVSSLIRPVSSLTVCFSPTLVQS